MNWYVTKHLISLQNKMAPRDGLEPPTGWLTAKKKGTDKVLNFNKLQ
jgi:hypothetical protein